MRRKTLEFLSLQTEWYTKLKELGFEDIEHSRWSLLQRKYDPRSGRYQNRDRLEDFYMDLDAYLDEADSLTDRDWLILTLYSEGKYVVDICKTMRVSHVTIHKVIRRYKRSLP